MHDRLPLPALLSCALVAFMIEFDNEFEHRMPRRTTDYGASSDAARGPWLCSMVMWMNCMQFVSERGITVREVERLARTRTNWDGMRRWGYISFEPTPAGTGAKHIKPDAVVRPKPAGRKAIETWRPLAGIIEGRWRERFGNRALELLRASLCAIARKLDADLPDCLPILGYGLSSKGLDRTPGRANDNPGVSELSLAVLLSRVLLTFALEFERESEVSLAISANVLRLVGDEGVRVRDLPLLSGVSKEAIAMALSFLEKRGYALLQPESQGSRMKALLLTPKGRCAREAHSRLLGKLECEWQERFGQHEIEMLRRALEPLVGDGSAPNSPLFPGLKPYPENWRAHVPPPQVLPHYPMVLHRGGFPDGS